MVVSIGNMEFIIGTIIISIIAVSISDYQKILRWLAKNSLGKYFVGERKIKPIESMNKLKEEKKVVSPKHIATIEIYQNEDGTSYSHYFGLCEGCKKKISCCGGTMQYCLSCMDKGRK